MRWRRTQQIVRKEIIQIRRERATLRIMIIAPLFQLLVFGYVVATEIRELPMVVLDRSESAESRNLVEKFQAAGYFVVDRHVESLDQVTERINLGHAVLGLVIPPGYATHIRKGTRAQVQLLVDGTNSNTATIALGYAGGVVAAENQKLMKGNSERLGFQMVEAGIRQEERVWFNPSLRAINYMIPGILCVLLMQMLLPMTAFSLVKERERGTIEQLMVTPIRAGEILVGKTIPYIFVGFLDIILILTLGTLWFRVPIAGSVLALLGYASIFILVALGWGILIATVARTQQQAALMSQFVMVPNLLLSGFMFPIESMPDALQKLTYILPMRYFLVMVRGVIMKDASIADLWPQAVALAILGIVVFSISWLRFRKVFA